MKYVWIEDVEGSDYIVGAVALRVEWPDVVVVVFAEPMPPGLVGRESGTGGRDVDGVEVRVKDEVDPFDVLWDFYKLPDGESMNLKKFQETEP